METLPSNTEDVATKLQRLELLEQKIKLREGLPHLYGLKHYKWSREFFNSINKNCFLTAANQIGKSSVQIRKCIDWATDKKKWATLWPHRNPSQFWYFYPTKDVCGIEFYEKWEREFLPKHEFRTSPEYGWKLEVKDAVPAAIHFNSGVSIYFKSYAQKLKDLQSGTVDAIFLDEELPEEYWDELNFRRTATDGYVSMVFTATLGQEMWRRTMEERGREQELFPDAHKQTVSVYDCLQYEDGSNSHWTKERIRRIERSCKSEAEVQRRVFGRFVVDGGLKYPGFSRSRNFLKPSGGIPKDWNIYAGIDIGQGMEGHPSAIAFIAVNPEFTKGRVFKGWRGDYETTTAQTTFDKYRELRGGMALTGTYYDWNSKDFFVIATNAGEAIIPAEKSHSIGEQFLNVLFKNGALVIDDIPELEPLVTEFTTLKLSTPKAKAKDDFIDGVRYGVTKIPWDWASIVTSPEDMPEISVEMTQERRELDARAKELADRRALVVGSDSQEMAPYTVEDELEEWGSMYGA